MKRGNDNAQMRREEVEAMGDDDDNSEDGAERGTFKRASADVIAGRKIVKIKGRGGPAPAVSNATVPAAAPALPLIGFGTTSSAAVSNDSNERAKKVKKLNESFLKWASKQIETHPLSIWKEGVKDYIKHYKGIEEKYGAETSSSAVSEKPAAAAPPPAAAPIVSFAAAPAAAKSSPFADFSFGAKPSTATPAVTAVPVAATKSAPAPATASPFSNFAFPAAAAPAAPAAPATLPSFAPATTVAPAKLGDFKFGAAPAAPAAAGFGSVISFGAPPASTNNDAAATASFLNNFASVPAPAFGAGGFGAPAPAFGAGGFGAPAPAFGGFGSTAALASNNGASAGGEEDGEGGDDEGEPILEPEKVLRNSNDTDEILHEVPCKLYGYSTADKEWKDTGKGTFRITRDAKTQKQRMLVRNQIGRINFNAAFFSGMKVEQVQKKIKFAAFVTVEDTTMGADGKAAPARTEMKNFMIQLKAEDVDTTLKKMQSGIASV